MIRPTRPDPGRGRVPPTRDDPGRGTPPPTRDDSSQPDPAAGWLPALPELAARYDQVRPLASHGQGELYLVRDRDDGREYVLKVYYARQLNELVVQRGGHFASRHVVRHKEIGELHGRSYEVMEYLDGGNLRDLLATDPVGLPTDVLATVIAHVAEALAELHRYGIIHRDLNPSNIMLRSRHPLDVVLTDLGISGEETDRGTRSGTAGYEAPETMLPSGSRDAAPRDWWALGITVAELATGHHPFEDMVSDEARESAIGLRQVDLGRLADDRLRLLCSGLLTRDPYGRWGYEQVSQWLNGETPAVEDIGGEEAAGPVYRFAEADFRDPAVLAYRLATDWARARTTLYGGDGSARQRLIAWASEVRPDRPAAPDTADRPPDVRLLHLLHWLDPAVAPVYRGRQITEESLSHMVRAVLRIDRQGPAAHDEAIIEELWHHHLLPILAGAKRTAALSLVDQRWRLAWMGWHQVTSELRHTDPDLTQPLVEVGLAEPLAALLWLALDRPAALATVRARVDAAVVDDEIVWYARLSRPHASPAELIAGYLLIPQARAETERLQLDRAAERAALLAFRERYRLVEWHRRQARPVALGWAVIGVTVVAVAWTWLIGIADVLPFASDQAITVAWVTAVLALVPVAEGEIWLAATIGGLYHPTYSLLRGLIRRGGEAGRWARGRGRLAFVLLLCVAALLVAATIAVPPVLPALSVVGYALSLNARARRWWVQRDADHERLARARQVAIEERRADTALAGGDS